MKLFLVVMGYLICLLFELPVQLKQERKKLVLYSLLMAIGLIETICIITIKDLPSVASLIQSIFEPISNKIYGS